MRYRIYFEPMDIEINENLHYEQIEQFAKKLRRNVSLSRILPIDKDGFPISSN